MNELDCLKNYVDIVRHQGLSQAHRHNNVPISILSKQLSWLENYYGVSLVERSNRRFVVTDIGMLCYERAKQIVDYLNDTEARLADLANELIGEVKISYPATFFKKQCAHCLVNLSQHYPKLRLSMRNDDFPYAVTDGRTDIAISVLNVNSKDLVQHQLINLPQSVYAAPSYLKTHTAPKTIDELSKHNCLVNPANSKDNAWEMSDGDKVFVSGNFNSTDNLALIDACLEGVGIFCYPDYFMQGYQKAGQVQALTLDKKPQNAAMYLYHAPNLQRANVQTAVDFIVNDFAKRYQGDAFHE